MEQRLDEAEGVLHNLVQAGDPRMVEFFLKTQGKKRNFTTQQEMVVTPGYSNVPDGDINTAIQERAKRYVEARRKVKRLGGKTSSS